MVMTIMNNVVLPHTMVMSPVTTKNMYNMVMDMAVSLVMSFATKMVTLKVMALARQDDMNNWMNVVMLVTMDVQRDRVSMVMSSVTKMDTNNNNPMKVVMLVTMAVQRDNVSMVMSSVTKMDNNMNNPM
jgi:hypothetical protein